MTVEPNPVPSFTAIELSVLIARFFEGSILKLKWPNDLLNKHDKKCCGILVQSFNGKMAAGIGINLFSDHFDFGGVYDSSFAFSKKSWAAEIADFILKNRFHDPLQLGREWEERSAHMDKLVRVTEGDVVHEGIFKGIGNHGQALVLTSAGEEQIYNGTLRILSSDR